MVCVYEYLKKRKTVILYKVAHIKSINSGNFHSEYLGSIPKGESLRKMMLGVGLEGSKDLTDGQGDQKHALCFLRISWEWL